MVLEPAWRNLFENTLTVQFHHRLVGLCNLASGDMACIDAPAPATRICRRGGSCWCGDVAGWSRYCDVPPSGANLLWRSAHQMLAIIVFTIAVVQAEGLSHREMIEVQRSSMAEQGA